VPVTVTSFSEGLNFTVAGPKREIGGRMPRLSTQCVIQIHVDPPPSNCILLNACASKAAQIDLPAAQHAHICEK